MSGELAALANDVTPYVLTAVGAYGTAVLAQAQDEAAIVDRLAFGGNIIQTGTDSYRGRRPTLWEEDQVRWVEVKLPIESPRSPPEAYRPSAFYVC